MRETLGLTDRAYIIYSGAVLMEGRADDTREAITERMHEYRHLTEKVLDHYRKAGVKLHEIDGLGAVEEVFGRIQGALKGSNS